MDYQFTTKIKDKKINYRKWKVKDKKKYIANKENQLLRKEALVFDCIEEENIGLSEEEYKHMLFLIREKSIQDKIQYHFMCSECEHEFEYEISLEEVMKSEFKGTNEIVQNDHIFTMSNIKNRAFYEETMSSGIDEETYIIDFILHIDQYNDQSYNFEQMNEIINNMDVGDFEEVFKKWEDMRFKVNSNHGVICPECTYEEIYEFDDLPGFFPDSWGT